MPFNTDMPIESGRHLLGADTWWANDSRGTCVFRVRSTEKEIRGKTMAQLIDITKHWRMDKPIPSTKPLQLVQITNREVAVVPFTSSTTLAKLHYCEDPEIRGYIKCNGEDCVLCRIGSHVEERALLPVYLPAQKGIGVLAISPTSYPGSLRPQLMPYLESGKSVVLFIRKMDRMYYSVGGREEDPAKIGGVQLIKDFEKRLESSEIDLTTVYQSSSNQALARVDSIATMMQLKGITIGDADTGP